MYSSIACCGENNSINSIHHMIRCMIGDQRDRAGLYDVPQKVACPKNEQIDLIKIQNSWASYMTTLGPLLWWYPQHQDKHFTHIFTRSLSTLKSLQILDSDNAMINVGDSYLPWSTRFQIPMSATFMNLVRHLSTE